jgi:hypothetical protein
MTRLRLSLIAGVLALAIAAVAAPTVGAQSTVPEMSGVWKLNVDASTNPNGPPAAARGGKPRGGGGGGSASGGGGGGGEGGGGGPANGQEASTLSPQEQQRFNAIKAMAFKAPEMMAIQATPTDFKVLLDPATKQGFAHKTDNKKQTLDTPGGATDFKVKWDGKKLHREYETKDSFKCVEEYALSADGSQLIVTVRADSGMVRNVQVGDIKRVYDRQKQ